MCLQQEYAEVVDKINQLHYKPNPTSGRNYMDSDTKTTGDIIDLIFDLQEKERDLRERIFMHLSFGNKEIVYGK